MTRRRGGREGESGGGGRGSQSCTLMFVIRTDVPAGRLFRRSSEGSGDGRVKGGEDRGD